MKTLRQIKLLFLLLFVAQVVNAQTQMNLPVTFDSSNVNYGLVSFGGTASTIVVDPTNPANQVAKVIKTNTAELWAGTTVSVAGNPEPGFSSPIPFTSTEKRMNVRFWSPTVGTPIRLKVEMSTDNTKTAETEAVTTVIGWQTLEFNFGNVVVGTNPFNLATPFNKVSIFCNFGTTGATAGEKTYYFDDIKFGAAPVGPLTQMNLPVTFNASTVEYGLVSFGGTASTIVVDPTDANNQVAKVIKTNTAEVWAGTTISVAGTPEPGFSSPIPFTASEKRMNLRFWSPTVGTPIRLKVEMSTDNTKTAETEVLTTVVGWQTLEFNFANVVVGTNPFNIATPFNKVSIFCNFGTSGATAGEKTYYFDDVKFGAAPPPPLAQMSLPVNFNETTVDYGLVSFGGTNSTIVIDPTDANNKVAKVIKSNTAELWAGTTISVAGTPEPGFGSVIPFTANEKRMNLRFWSPTVGTPIRLKVEMSSDNTKTAETEAVTTVVGWQTLEFNFANVVVGTNPFNLATPFNKVSIFCNFGTTGATAGEKTYYFDDVKFGAAGGPVASSKVSVKFTVDTKNLPMNAGDTITLNGTFNNWCGACTPMTNIVGTKMWTTTIELDTNIEYEYKYVIGAWKSSETLNPALTACTKTTGAFTNRVYKSTKTNDSIPMMCWESCSACSNTGGPTKTYVTFSVDMSKNIPAAGDTVTLNGTFNGWCGACTPMVKVGNTNVWRASVLLDKDSTYDFKYVIGAWKSQELLKEGSTCTTTKSGFTNRTITVSKLNDTLPTVCWESCLSCQNTAPKAKVTFKVNMKNFVDDSLSIKGVTLNGSFNGWCGDCTKMTPIGNNIWATTLTLDTGAYDFKFTIGNWLDQEQFSASDPCTKTVGNFTNRFLQVSDTAAKIVGTYCWNTCTICDAIGVNEQALNSMKVYPNPASESLFIDLGTVSEKDAKVYVYNMLGEVMITKTNIQNNGTGTINLDTRSLKQGIYLLKVEAGNAVKTIKFQRD